MNNNSLIVHAMIKTYNKGGLKMGEQKMKAKWYGPKQIGMIVFTGVLMLLSACFVGGQTNTVLPYLAEFRGWDENLLRIISSIACILDGLGILLWAKMSRKNAKALAGASLVVMAICLVIFGFTTNLVVLAVVMLVMGLSSAAFSSTCAMTLTANWWPTKKGVVLGFSTMGIVLMSVLYVPIMPTVYATLGIQKAQLILAVITIIVAIIAFALIKNTPEEAGTTPDGLEGVDLSNAKEISKALSEYKSPFTFKQMITNPNNWIVSLAVGLPLMVAMSFISSLIPALLSYGYAFPQASGIMAAGGIVALIGSALLGALDTKMGTRRTVWIFIIFVLVAIISAIFMPKGLGFAWAAGMILFCANGGARNLLPSYVATIYGRWDYPAAYQVMGTVFLVLCGLGVMIPALFPSYTVMFIFDAVVCVVALILSIVAKDKFIGKPN